MNGTEEDFSDVPSGVVLVLVGSFGIISTLLLIAVILYFGYLKNDPPFIAIFSLAGADLGHLIIIVYHVAPELISTKLTRGAFEEPLMSHGNFWVWTVSLGHFSFIAINRFCAVVFPTKLDRYFSRKNVSISILSIWVVALLFALIPLNNVCCRKILDIHHDTEDDAVAKERNIMLIIVWVLNVITFVIIVVCYSAIAKKMWKRTQNKVSIGMTTSQQREQAKRARKAAMISLQFGIISAIFTTLLVFNFVTTMGVHSSAAIHGLQIFYSVNSSVNPVIYCVFNVTLRAQMMKFLCMGKELLSVHSNKIADGKSAIQHPSRKQRF